MCWLFAIVVTAAIAFAVYKFLIVGGQKALEHDNAERARLAEERKRKRIAESGYDPLAPASPENVSPPSDLVDPSGAKLTPGDAPIPLEPDDSSPAVDDSSGGMDPPAKP